VTEFKFCPKCGDRLHTLNGRLVCQGCGYIFYRNPTGDRSKRANNPPRPPCPRAVQRSLVYPLWLFGVGRGSAGRGSTGVLGGNRTSSGNWARLYCSLQLSQPPVPHGGDLVSWQCHWRASTGRRRLGRCRLLPAGFLAGQSGLPYRQAGIRATQAVILNFPFDLSMDNRLPQRYHSPILAPKVFSLSTPHKIKPALVFPAKAGIQKPRFWVPAYAGTTGFSQLPCRNWE